MVRKSQTATATRTYSTLNEWMAAEGINATELIALVRECGEPISKGHMSNILKGSCQCSLRKALILSQITNGQVPVDAIKQWPKVGRFRIVRSIDPAKVP